MNNIEYQIKQIKDLENCNYAFCHYNYHKDEIKLADYEVVYSGEVIKNEDETEYDVLEKLFVIFNCKHPKDFKGHSLSTSDIVELNGINYYCDSFGWVKL